VKPYAYRPQLEKTIPYFPGVAAALRQVVGQLATIRYATADEDRGGYTDLVVLGTPDRGVALRLRGFGTAGAGLRCSFGHEFTIRSAVKYGGETELHKIRRGDGADLMFYGWVDPDRPPDLLEWTVVDMRAFSRALKDGTVRGKTFDNGDGSQGTAYRFSDCPDGVVLLRFPAPAPGWKAGELFGAEVTR
jgi:hypothetical protein